MIINEIYIDGFGVFNNYKLTNLGEGVNIIEGKNEAGKSTLLEFIRQIFFGQDRNDYKHEPLNGGRHGGRINVTLSNGEQATFERFFGRGGLIRMTYSGNNSTDSFEWQQKLGRASKSLHKNIYAFTLDELVAIKNLEESGMEDKLNSVSMGMGEISIGDLEGYFWKQADSIYTSRGRVQKIPALLGEINELRTKLRDLQSGLLNYNQTIEGITELEKQTVQINSNLGQKEKEKRKYEIYNNCFETVIELYKLDEELETSPAKYDCPEDGLVILEQLEKEEQLYQNTLSVLKENPAGNGIAQLNNKIETIHIDEQLLGNKDKIEYLKTNLEVYKQTIKVNQETQNRITDLQEKIIVQCNKIDPQWTADTVRHFAKSLVHKDTVRQFEEKVDALKEKKIKAEAKHEAIPGKITDYSGYFKIGAIICLLLAAAFFFVSIPVGVALLFIAVVLFFGNSFMPKNKLKTPINEVRDIDAEIEIINKQFNSYLETTLFISKNLSFKATYDALDIIERTQDQISEETKLLSKQQNELKASIQNFEQKASEIVPHFDLNESVEVQLKGLFLDFETQQSFLSDKQQLKALLENKKIEEKTSLQKLNASLIRINELLDVSNCSDRISFRKKYTNEKQSRILKEKRRNLLMTIEKITSVQEAANTISFLKTQQQHELRDNLSGLELEISFLKEQLQTSSEELGKLKRTKETLTGESHISEIETGIATWKQNLTNAYKEWLTNRISAKVLSDVKRKYESEKQPGVIKEASDLFYQITDKRYRLNISIDNKQITVVENNGAIKSLDELSRGTKEQLLICLRLGYINEYEKTSEPLPLVLDDVMVNFDPYRAKGIADILETFSEKRQVLILTCHPVIGSYFINKTVIALK